VEASIVTKLADQPTTVTKAVWLSKAPAPPALSAFVAGATFCCRLTIPIRQRFTQMGKRKADCQSGRSALSGLI
jgi:hypothetical protein